MTTLRLAADTTAAALGVNTWLSLVFIPSLVTGAMSRHPALWAIAPLPLVLLFFGVIRRSPLWLLLAYPASLLLPVAVDPRIASEGNAGRLSLIVSALSLVGFLFGAAYLSSYAAAEPPAGRRTLRSSLAASQPARWRRRRRVYIMLTAVAAIFPTALLYEVGLSRDTAGFLAELYPGDRAPAMRAMLLVGVLLMWLILLSHAVIDPLRRHRTGDKELVHELDRLRKDARQGTPRLSFYVGVVFALALMALILVMRFG